MARKPTIAKFIRDKMASKRRIAKTYRDEAKMVQKQGDSLKHIVFPELDSLTLYHNGYCFQFSYAGRDAEHAKQIRVQLGQLLSINNWERKVDTYTGTVSYEACFSEHCHKITITGGELAPGCKLVEVVETVQQRRFKTVCGESAQQTA